MKLGTYFLVYGPSESQKQEMNRAQFSGACRRINGEPVLVDAHPTDKAPNDLHVFSIPYGLTVYKQPLPDQIGHFVTTNSNNDRSYGTFISYTTELGTNRYAVNSICVISEHPLFEISKNLLLFLKFFTNQTASGKKDMKQLYIDAYINIIELDKQNEVEIIHFPISSPYRDQVFIHYSSCLPNYEYGLLFEAFSAESIIDLFCCLLLEQKILMVTNSTQFLCPIAETLISLLSPLTWHHVYVPYLSSAITDYLDVPVPFFMGVSRSEQVKKDCIVADIDAGKLIIPEGVEIPTPPVPYTTRLFKDLKDIMGSSEQRQKKYLKVKNAFQFFFVEIFRDIVDFIRGTGFDDEGFLEMQTKENRPFMELLIKTEAFNQFIYNKNSSAFADFMKQISDIKRTDSFIYRSQQSTRIDMTIQKYRQPKRMHLHDIFNLYYRIDEVEDDENETPGNEPDNRLRKYQLQKKTSEDILIKNLDTGEYMLPCDIVEFKVNS